MTLVEYNRIKVNIIIKIKATLFKSILNLLS